jgi:plastocyanin
MKRRFLMLGLAALIGACVATAPMLSASAAPATLPMTASFTATDYAWNASGGGSTVSVATGGTVDFSYPSGHSIHNVDFGSGMQPSSCTVGGNSATPPVPSSPQAPGWTASCTFNTPGIYTFHCDEHTFMTGTIDVGSQATTTTSTQSPTTGSTTTGTMTMPMNMPMPTTTTSGQTTPVSSLAGNAATAIKVTATQHGGQVRGTIKVSAGGKAGHALITLWATSATLHGKRARAQKLTTIATERLGKLHEGTVNFTVTADRTALHALTKLRHLAVTVRISVTAPGAQTAHFSKAVVLHA